jgi:hypothetical protein
MRASKFRPPYERPRKTTFIDHRWKPGVYLICEDGVLVYVGYAGKCLYRTLYRHFQHWTHKNYASNKVAPPPYRVSYRNLMDVRTYVVRLIHCSQKQAARLEKMLILKYNPRDNRMKYERHKPDGWDSRVLSQYQVASGKYQDSGDFVPQMRDDCPF